MQIPASVDLNAWRNADWTELFEFADGPIPLNLTGWSFALQVRAQPGQVGAALVSLTMGAGLTSAGADLLAGVLNLRVLAATMEALAASPEPGAPLVLHYDLKATTPAAVVSLFLEGRLMLWNGVTR